MDECVEGVLEKADLGLVETQRVPMESLVRETFLLEREDLLALREMGPEHTSAGLKHIRAFHKIVALRLAIGEKPVEICANLSITPQTISRLVKEPQFAQLVEFYQEKVTEKAIDLTEMMNVVSFEALTALHERLVGNERDDISIESLRKLGVDFADRTGFSPVRRTESTNRQYLGIDPETLERIKLSRAENARLVEGELVRTHEEDSKASGATASLAEVVGTLEAKAPARIESEGEGV
jgi:hypothetical protein